MEYIGALRINNQVFQQKGFTKIVLLVIKY